MTPLLTASTVTATPGERREHTPSETGWVRLDLGMGLGALFGEAPENQPREEDSGITTHLGVLLTGMFTNTTGGTARYHGQAAYYKVDPSARRLYFRLPTRRGKAEWVNVAMPESLFSPELGTLSLGWGVGVKPLLTGSESVPSDQVQPLAQASTEFDPSRVTLQKLLSAKLKTTFGEAAEEVFVDGMESAFSRRLNSIIWTFGAEAVRATEGVMQLEPINVEVAAEAIRQMGLIADARSHQTRLTVLLSYLGSPDARLRDAASIGIAALDDPAAIKGIGQAISRERSALLRRNLQLVLNQLEETQQWRAS